jgi:hypothetical protein
MSAAASLILDVFRQARASGLSLTLLIVTLVAAGFCLTAVVVPTNNSAATALSLGFGSYPISTAANSAAAVAHLHFILAGIVADTAGVLLALIWTAGFLPSFLDPSAASVMLAKPTSRSLLFAARVFGVVIYVGLFAMLFVATTWLALGARTGVWSVNYWLCVPLLVAHFAVFYAFSALLAVVSRNATVCIVGSIVFWALCWAMNYGRHALAGVRLEEVQRASAGLGRIAELGYWIMPKPADFSLILADTLGAEQFATPWMAFKAVREAGQFHPLGSVLSSLAVGAVFLAIAAYEFVHDDY